MNACSVCGKDLSKQEEVYAGLGHLCCSKHCCAKLAIKHLTNEQIEIALFDAFFEEVTTSDIGICDEFNETNPDDEEFYEDDDALEWCSEKCSWCGEVFDESEVRKTDIGFMCDQCIAAVRSRGEQVIILD